MKAPNWIPKVSRPFNPAWSDAWDAMSDDEKRWSFLIDALLIAGVFGLAWYFS
jgi:hypothetical protein